MGVSVLHLAVAAGPALALATCLRNGPGLGAVIVLALVGSGLVIAATRGLVPGRPALAAGLAGAIGAAVVAGLLLVRRAPALAERLGSYLPAVTASGLALGRSEVLGAGLGFVISVALLVGLGERLELAPLPRPLRGAPVALIAAGLISMAFMGFSGMIRV
jgi:electron transport complex protein RnfA